MSLFSLSSSEFKTASVEATADGENTVIAAPGAGKRIIVLGYAFTATAEGTITIKTSSGTKAKFNVAKQGGVAYAGNLECPAFVLSENKALVVENPAGVDTIGHITYVTAVA